MSKTMSIALAAAFALVLSGAALAESAADLEKAHEKAEAELQGMSEKGAAKLEKAEGKAEADLQSMDAKEKAKLEKAHEKSEADLQKMKSE